LRPEQSPCLELPEEAWEEPGLLSYCPKCSGELKFNPFMAGNIDSQDSNTSFDANGYRQNDNKEYINYENEDKEISENKTTNEWEKSIDEDLLKKFEDQLYPKQDTRSKLDIEKENREKAIKEKLLEESRYKIEDIDQEFTLMFEEAEKAFTGEKWEKAKTLYLKLVQQGRFDANYMRYNMAICDLNSLTTNNPEIINHINILIKLLKDCGAGDKAQLIAEKLRERLDTVKQAELLKKNERKPWWKKHF
jgi:hypothetical protein